jgi:PAS domain S-box-containing protein
MTRPPPPERCEVILDSIADGVFTVDAEWRITSFNRAAERITGTPRDQAVGRRCWEVFRSDICEASCALRETMRTGRNIVNRAIHVLDAAGQRVPVSISTAILRDRGGGVIGGVESFRDLTTVEELRKELAGTYSVMDIVGRSRPMQELLDLLPHVAASESTVLIEGASGTGKELVARAIHSLSPRRAGPFVAVNCGALPDTLLESELFGSRAGACTGARADRAGRFARAEGGTILLDEIGNVSPAMQVRLLRVLQERQYEPLGADEAVPADVRVVAATNRSLARLVAEGAFREDLYYRINVVRLRLPELRDRREDIPLLVHHFIGRFNRIQGKEVAGVSNDVMGALMEHDYPGNVRELANIIERAFVVCQTGQIEREHLSAELRGPTAGASGGPGPGTRLRELEAMHIADAVRRHGGNRTAAARELGIDPSTLFRKVQALRISLPEKDGRSRG